MCEIKYKTKSEILGNIKRNWYFPISALAFFFLGAALNIAYFISMAVSFCFSVFIASQVHSMKEYVLSDSKAMQFLIFLTSVGICWGNRELFYKDWSASPKTQAIQRALNISFDFAFFISMAGAVCSFLFVTFFLSVFFKALSSVFSKNRIFCDIDKREAAVYIIMIILSFAFVVFSFTRSYAFYTGYGSTIYSADSAILLQNNAYLALTYEENDIRQPFFAVFASPLMGLPFLISRIFRLSETNAAILLNFAQIILLFAANFMLSKSLDLNRKNRICFMILSSCTYAHIIFTLMMEQYIISYFYLSLTVYLICKNKRSDKFAVFACGGTMLTSLLLSPTCSDNSIFKNFKAWFKDMLKLGFGFLFLFFAFCRVDLILNIVRNITGLIRFTGKELTFTNKVYQYFEFIKNIFASPKAESAILNDGLLYWQLKPVTSLNIIGVIILILCVLSFIINHKKIITMISGIWIVFSAFMLLILGWGTAENNLVLYSLYFGWSFFILLFQLAENLERKLKLKLTVPVLTAVLSVTMLILNIKSLGELFVFLFSNFPA